MQQPDQIFESLSAMTSDELHNMAEAVRQIQLERAIGSGNHDAIISAGFEVGFGRDGLANNPWIEGETILCPGGLISKSRVVHRCRFVSVDDVWVWESSLMLREDKRSSPGAIDGFRAIALLPVIDGICLDVVTGRAKSTGHSVEHVISFEVRGGVLVEVSQRAIRAGNML